MVNLFENKYLGLNFRIFLAFSLSLVAVSFLIDVKPFIFLGVFCILNALFLTYERYVELPLDFELSTFSAVLMAVRFGVVWGLLAGILTKVASIAYNRDLNMNSIITIGQYMFAAFLAHLLYLLFRFHIISLGIIVVLIANIYSFFVLKFVNFVPYYHLVMYSISNILFNIILFLGFSRVTLGIMF